MSKLQKEIIPPEGARLFVDVGNSSLKAAFIEGRHWKNPHQSGLDTASDFVEWVNLHSGKFELIVVVSVVEKISSALSKGIKSENCRILTVADIPSDMIEYESPETLGLDRFFGCYGAVAHTGKAAVVIDSGTACTIDYMTGGFTYRGGVIMPGLSTVEAALKEHLPALPEVAREIPGVWPGKSTEDSLKWGVTGMYIESIGRTLDKYSVSFGDFDLFVTGGEAGLVSQLLEWEVRLRPSLVFDGMRDFLEEHL